MPVAVYKQNSLDMKKRTLIILLVLLALGGIALTIAYRMYNKPHPDYVSLPADIKIDVQDLYETYVNDPESANKQFTGKMVEIVGVPARLESENGLIAVFVMAEGMFGDEGVRCVFVDGQAPINQDFLDGAPKKIKGFCVGFNETDVLLEKCSWVN